MIGRKSFLGASPVQVFKAGMSVVLLLRATQLLTETMQEIAGTTRGELGPAGPAPRALSEIPVCGDRFDDVHSGAAFVCRCAPGHPQPHVSWVDGHTPERFWTRLDNGELEQVLIGEKRPW